MNKTRVPANQQTVSVSAPGRQGVANILCEKAYPTYQDSDACKKWVADNIISMSMLEMTNKICKAYDLIGRQATCFKTAVIYITVDQYFSDQVLLCSDRTSNQSKVDCFSRLFLEYATPKPDEDVVDNSTNTAP